MASTSEIQKFLESPLVQRDYEESHDAAAPAALPTASLEFLIELARRLEIKSVFEFGSGRSTVEFLKAGCAVASLEDSPYWMEQTLGSLSGAEKARHAAWVRPLTFRLHGLVPARDWVIDAELAAGIRSADLVLIDSPYYPPFRESTLWSALNLVDRGLVVLDDTRIPTMRRFCDKLARDNPGLLHAKAGVGHGFDLFARRDDAPLKFSHGPMEVLKGWRRYWLAGRNAG